LGVRDRLITALALAFLVSVSSNCGQPAGPSGVPPAVWNARGRFLSTANKMGDGSQAWATVDTAEKTYALITLEKPLDWSNLDRDMSRCAPETVAAYQVWRDEVIKSHAGMFSK
jgi:hypothetical protein